MPMNVMRKLTINPLIKGFWSGVSIGMNSSDFAFDAPKVSLRGFAGGRSGWNLDREALRQDVKKAKSRFARTIAQGTYPS